MIPRFDILIKAPRLDKPMNQNPAVVEWRVAAHVDTEPEARKLRRINNRVRDNVTNTFLALKT